MYIIYEISKIFLFCSFFTIINIKKNQNNNLAEISISNEKKNVKDVLFINGCNPNSLPHPYRYRVLHQMEQLNAGFLESDECYYSNFSSIIIKNYRALIFFRCPWNKNIEQAITLAKSLNKKILFDIDDLVIDKKYI